MNRGLFGIFTLLLQGPAAADATIFDAGALLDVDLAGPLAELDLNRDRRDTLPFELVIDGETRSVSVRVRGKSRLRVCSFMPLKLEFDREKPIAGLPLHDDDLKLVTHCYDSATGDAYVLRELLAYRILSVLTDAGFRTRLLRVTYTDPGDDDYDTTRYAFLLESTAGIAHRLGGKVAKLPGVSLAGFDQAHLALVYVFQYLIGNTDWSLVVAEGETDCCHNAKLVDVDGRLYYLPYDFDLSGLVNARYAKPDVSIGIRRVTSRRYRGFCMDRSTLAAALDRVVSERDAILGLVDELPWPTDRHANQTRDYVASFFERAADSEKLLARFEKRCLD